jgi:hypothetical protein
VHELVDGLGVGLGAALGSWLVSTLGAGVDV